MDENERPSEMPRNIGRYQVLESVGFGAMGAVYKAFDPLIKRTLAIKTIRLDIPRQSPQYKSFIDRFYHEARISGTLSHPNIVTLFDIGEEGGLPYLAMEFVEGETIMSLIEKGVRFKPEKVIGLVSQMASAIDYAHSKGVIHRDIKPSNVILYEEERIKVTDFGIAKLVDSEMTQAGQLLGTPSYMSPEQAMGEKLDGRSDIFSLGVCAFEMLSGEQPFPGPNVTSILYKLVHVDPIEPANLEMHGLVPQKWHEVFSRVLAKKPDDRYQTATEFVQDLEFCLGAWFGAVPDVTLTETLTGAERPPEPTLAMPPPPPDGPAAEEEAPATLLMSARELSQAGKAAAAATPAPPAPSPVDMEGTVVMPPAPARPAPPAPPVEMEGTVMMPAAAPAPTAAPPTPAAVAETDGTLRIAPPAPERPAAPAAPAPPPSPPAEPAGEGTILMAAAPAPPASPRSAPTEAEGTVLMPKAAEVEGTVVMPPPPPPRVALSIPPPPLKPVPPMPPPIPQVAGAAAEPAAAVRRSVPVALLAGAGGLLLLVGAIAIGALMMKRGDSAEPTPAPSLAATVAPTAPPTSLAVPAMEGTLHVETEPAGATVTVDGVVRGTSPVDVTGLTPGPHEVKVEQAGFAAQTQTVDISSAAPAAVLKLPLSKTGPVMGAADITTNPVGASVTVDGVSVGRTPLRNHRLRTGSRSVELSAEGYERWTGKLNVREGRRARLDIFLKAVPKATPVPTPTPEVVDPNRVYEAAQVDVAPRKVSGNAAGYPRGAPKLKAALTVGGVALVTADGTVADVTITQSGGSVVDNAVASAVRNWKFSPGVKKGVKVKVRVPFRQTFLPG